MGLDPSLKLFSSATATWFDAAFSGPTAAQRGAWEAIAAGRHALVVAPTGSGKTLAAFLWAIDQLISRPSDTTDDAAAGPSGGGLPASDSAGGGTPETKAAARQSPGTGQDPLPGTEVDLRAKAKRAASPAKAEEHTTVLYISPLKALGVDVERNLRAPLIGITQAAKAAGITPPDISVGVRSGDTPQATRRALLAHPPDILITISSVWLS